MNSDSQRREEVLAAVREALYDYHRSTGQIADDLSLALSLAELSDEADQ